jgi:hypothetical protein
MDGYFYGECRIVAQRTRLKVPFHAAIDYPTEGKTHFKFELTWTGVPDTWKDVLPSYAHVGDKSMKIGSIVSSHPSDTFEATSQLRSIALPSTTTKKFWGM